MERIGLLAGAGTLPVECARAAVALGYEVYAVALLDETEAELDSVATECAHISIAQLGKILAYLKEKEIRQVTLLGKVTKEYLFNGKLVPDMAIMALLATLPDRKDDTIMKAFVGALAGQGFTAFDQTALIKALMPAPGVLSKREPTAEEKEDMEFGLAMARELGRLDVGQTVVVKDKAVMALEAIEGTDACIRRGGELARGGAVVVKAAKPQQDNRFDVPAVGAKTLESMIAVGAKALGIEAGKTILAEKERVLALAEEHDIAIVAL